jgi:biotin transport system substrate-specific component
MKLQNPLPPENRADQSPDAMSNQRMSHQSGSALRTPAVTAGRISYTDLVRIALFAALIAVLGLIPKFDLPFTAGVPITAQTLGVMLAGLVLGGRKGALAVLLFLFVVALGAPVLSGGRGGLGVFFGPTVGFLVGWVAGALVSGVTYRVLKEWMPGKVFLSALLACLIGGVLTIYAVGIPGLSIVAKMETSAAALATLAFLPGDILKSLVAAWLVTKLSPAVASKI